MAGDRKRRCKNVDHHNKPWKRRKKDVPRKKSIGSQLRKKAQMKEEVKVEEGASKKKRNRPRNKKLCYDAVDNITKALRTNPSPIGHLFNNLDEAGVPYGSLTDVVDALSLPQRLNLLTVNCLPLLNTKNHIFRVDWDTEDGMRVKYFPVNWNVEDCTVYIDRLPSPCSRSLVHRLCSKFGTVVDIRLPLRHPTSFPSSSSFTRNPSQPRGFAFVQFTSAEEANAMCQEYTLNDPQKTNWKSRWFFYRGRRVHCGKFTTRREAFLAMRRARIKRLKYRMEMTLRRKVRVKEYKAKWLEKRKKAARKKRRILDRQKAKEMRKRLREGTMNVEESEKKAEEVKKDQPHQHKNMRRSGGNQPVRVKKTRSEKRTEKRKKKREEKEKLRLQAEEAAKEASERSEGESMNGMVCSVHLPSMMEEGGTMEGEPSTSNSVQGNGREKVIPKKKKGKRMRTPIKMKRRHRPKRKEIRCSLASHFVDIQCIPFAEYLRLREEYLQLRKEYEKKEEYKEAIKGFKANMTNHRREEFRDANWSIQHVEEKKEDEDAMES